MQPGFTDRAMSVLRSKAFLRYLVGIALVAIGAQISSIAQSMWPLAMASAAAIMVTAGLVKAIHTRSRPTEK